MAFWNRKKKGECIHCAETIDAAATFCPYCGSPQESGIINCGKCGKDNPADATFCGKCGAELSAYGAPQTRQHTGKKIEPGVWARDAEQFAVRFDDDNLKGTFTKTITVEPGTQAIFFVDGKLIGTLPSGQYDLGALKTRLVDLDLNRKATIILIDEGEVGTYADATGMMTRDGFSVDIRTQLTFKIDFPYEFFVNLMKGKNSYLLSDFQEYMATELYGALQSLISRYNYQDLVLLDRDKMNNVEQEIQEHLHPTLRTVGISLSRIRAINISSEELASLVKARSQRKIRQLEIASEAENLKLDKMEWEVEKEANDFVLKQLKDTIGQKRAQKGLERDSEEIDVEHAEKRIKLIDRMRAAQNLDKISLARNEAELDKTLDQLNRDKLLRDDETNQLREQILNNKDDRIAARQFALEKLDEMRNQELTLIKADFKNKLAKMDDDESQRKLEAELRKMSYLRQHERSEMEKDLLTEAMALQQKRMIEIKTIKSEAEAEIELKKMKADYERYEDKLDMLTLKDMKEIKLWEERERSQMAREEKQFEQKMAMEMKRWEHESEMEKADQEHRHGLEDKGQDQQFELDKMDRIAAMGPEALIAMSPSEQAGMLAELKKTEALGTMSEDQILAMAAKDSPEVAKAFAERYKAMGGADREQFYERMLAEKDERMRDQERFREDQRRDRDTMDDRYERMHNQAAMGQNAAQQERLRDAQQHKDDVMNQGGRAMDSMQNVASSFATGQAPASSAPKQPQPQEPQSTRECPRCGKPLKVGWVMCPYCKFEFQ